MGASTGNMLVDDPAVLERLFACAPTILIAHCEDTPSITVNEENGEKRMATPCRFRPIR